MAESVERKFRVPIVPDCLWEIVAQRKDADNAFIVAMLRMIKARFDGMQMDVPKEYVHAWRLVEQSLIAIENWRKNRAHGGKPTDNDRSEPKPTDNDRSEPKPTDNDRSEPKPTCNVMEGNVMEGNVSVSSLSLTNTTSPRKPPKGGGSDPEFEKFWDAYGKKVSRKDAERAFARAKKSKGWPGLDALLAKVAEWRKTEDWTKDGGRFQPNAATWLNGEKWDDELPPEALAEAKKMEALNAPPPTFEMH